MTVKELIALLETFPADAPVVYLCLSDYADLEATDVALVDGERDFAANAAGLVRHNGTVFAVHASWMRGLTKAEMRSNFFKGVTIG